MIIAGAGGEKETTFLEKKNNLTTSSVINIQNLL